MTRARRTRLHRGATVLPPASAGFADMVTGSQAWIATPMPRIDRNLRIADDAVADLVKPARRGIGDREPAGRAALDHRAIAARLDLGERAARVVRGVDLHRGAGDRDRDVDRRE